MQNLLIICPTFGNKIEAISAHTGKMIDQIAKKKNISVLTSEEHAQNAKLGVTHINIISVEGAWNLFNLIGQLRHIKNFKPDTVFIQYVPFLYGRGGINFSLPFFALILRIFLSAKIVIYFHELYYPMEAKMKSMVMHVCHVMMLILIGHIGNHIFTTTEEFKKILNTLLVFQKKIACVPIGSNLDKIEVDQNQRQAFREKYQIRENELVIGSFGTFHPSKNYRLIFEILRKLKFEVKIPCRFIMIGQSPKDLEKYLGPELFSNLDGTIIALGKMNEAEINVAMDAMNIYIGYFVDGLSARRGSLIAALQAGLPVISTVTRSTDIIFFNQKDIYLYPIDEISFTASVLSLLKEKTHYFKTAGKINHTLYEEYFKWEIIMKKFEGYEGEVK